MLRNVLLLKLSLAFHSESKNYDQIEFHWIVILIQVATYRHAKVKMNYGPKFRHPPPPKDDLKFRPMSQRSEEAALEQAMSDMKFFTENEGKLKLDSFAMSP